MVSCDTWRASFPGCVRFSQPAICCGDQFQFQLRRNSLPQLTHAPPACTALGAEPVSRRACRRWRRGSGATPPLRPISRLMVEGARPSALSHRAKRSAGDQAARNLLALRQASAPAAIVAAAAA